VFDGADSIVVPSGSCSSMVSHHFADLCDRDSAEVEASRAVTSRVYEFSEFLLKVAKVEDFGARFAGVATYHDSCLALRDLKLKDEPRRLLRQVRDLELREMEPAEECCGFGGTFSVKFGEVSGSMVDDKVESIVRTGANTVVSIDSSCLMQIRGAISRRGLPIRAMHLAEVLAQTG
jgi:L-lactate dehydrogenase complex protein LldE